MEFIGFTGPLLQSPWSMVTSSAGIRGEAALALGARMVAAVHVVHDEVGPLATYGESVTRLQGVHDFAAAVASDWIRCLMSVLPHVGNDLGTVGWLLRNAHFGYRPVVDDDVTILHR